MDNEEPEDVILFQMHQTRSALVDKLETLEHQVVDTVQSATSAVAETVESVKEAVHDTVTTVKDSVQTTVTTVKESFDVRLQVERHPWAVIGGAVVLGYLGERLFSGPPSNPADGSWDSPRPRSNGKHAIQQEESERTPASRRPTSRGAQENPPAALAARSRWGLVELLGPEIAKAQGLALGALLGSVRDTIKRATPTAIETRVAEIIDRVTEKLGGEVITGPVLK
jgi:ElaB/YqjD/DUF883 family membrane-anchored ribosome-binding protein